LVVPLFCTTLPNAFVEGNTEACEAETVALVQTRAYKLGISCDDFWSKRCGYSDASAAYSTPSQAFAKCCTKAGHGAQTCNALAAEVFVNDNFDTVTEQECTELDALAKTHDLWDADNSVDETKSFDSSLQDKDPRRRRRRRRRRRATPTPTPAPTAMPTPAPTPPITTDFWTGSQRCRFTREEIEGFSGPHAAYFECCKRAGHTEDTCYSLGSEIFPNSPTFKDVTVEQCEELDSTYASHEAWEADHASLVAKKKGMALDETLRGKSPPTPSPVAAPTMAPTPTPTEDATVLEAKYGQCQGGRRRR
jgi:hypothetical protein